jgi:hypothetical protein
MLPVFGLRDDGETELWAEDAWCLPEVVTVLP